MSTPVTAEVAGAPDLHEVQMAVDVCSAEQDTLQANMKPNPPMTACTQDTNPPDDVANGQDGQATSRRVVFDRKIHSKDGLPTCAGCHKMFTKWPGLRKHIEAGHCPVLTSDIRPSGLSNNHVVVSQAMVDREDVKQAYRDGKHKALLNNQALMQELKQRCALCHTWVASSWMMKNHMHNSRGDFMKRHTQQCLDLCKEWGKVTKPCRYCGGNQNKADSKHLQKCTPLWQCTVIHHWFQEGHDGNSHGRCGDGVGGVLRGHLWQSSHARAGDHGAPTQGTADREPQGQGQATAHSQGQSQAVRFVRPPGGLATDDSCDHEAGGHNPNSSPGHGIRVVGQDGRTFCDPSPVQGFAAVEGENSGGILHSGETSIAGRSLDTIRLPVSV